jgi:hypothetical protein
MRVEIYGNLVAIFPKFPSGAVYRDEYLAVRFHSAELYDVVEAARSFLSPPTTGHFASYPIVDFNITQIDEFKWDMHAYWPGQRIHEIVLHWDFNSSVTAGFVSTS